jgi:hypothetical protein
MKRLPILVGIVLVSMVSSCKKEVIQPNGHCGVEETRESVKLNKIGGGASSDSSPSTGSSGGSITDPNDDDYSTRRPNKKISQ